MPRGEEKALASAEHVERLHAVNAAPDRVARRRERGAVLSEPDVGVALLAEAHDVAVVDPLPLHNFIAAIALLMKRKSSPRGVSSSRSENASG